MPIQLHLHERFYLYAFFVQYLIYDYNIDIARVHNRNASLKPIMRYPMHGTRKIARKYIQEEALCLLESHVTDG